GLRFELVREAPEGVERAEGLHCHELLVRLRTQRHPGPGRIWGVLSVLAGQPAAPERAERSEAEPLAPADLPHAVLSGRRQEVELVLDPGEAREPMCLARLERLDQLLGADVAGADRLDFAAANEIVERLERFANRNLGVGLVGEVHVDALDSEPLEARRVLSQPAVAGA